MRDGRVADAFSEQANQLAWLRENELLPADAPDPAPEALATIHAALRELREVCTAVLADLDRDGALTAGTFERMRAHAEAIAVALQATRDGEGRVALAPRGRNAVDAVRYPIVRSLFDTLTNVALDRIRACEHEACILHFVDTSKGGKRRWCSMESCGNRHKAAEFYAKKRQRAQG
ncbi:CGNR zinc finger domain-containing protein [Cohnella nanjingensis]|uniref:CGNR zinc finger domain-containing protein n=2 Tax=Cohnella nanjingensis TaxID=1387779 RepID=A0A7X0RLP6_9BACL|nr:CGNR zinc finger domain-containing protein [Cohnella nanjingensis]